MNAIDIIEQVYRPATQPVVQVRYLAQALRHWYQAFSACNYLQPCIIEGRAALVCQSDLSDRDPLAYRALQAICKQHGIYLKVDARTLASQSSVMPNRRNIAVILIFCLTMSASVQAENADQRSIAGQPAAVSMVINNQNLAHVTQKIAQQTGITFKFDAGIEDDVINQKLTATDWKSALGQLLQSYNYSIIQENNSIKKVYVTGYKGGSKLSSVESTQAQVAAGDSLQPQTMYQNRNALAVSIPTDELVALPEGSEMVVDLPVGAFTVKQESMVTQEDGTLSWVGTMDDENQFYRMYFAQSQDGEVVGNVYTPDGTYNIQSVDGQTVMLAVDQISMR